MKSRFAKITDRTLGACLVFFAATAVFRYYTALDLAVFGGVSATACALILSLAKSKRAAASYKISTEAADMFYAFMFLPDDAPPRMLCAALKTKTPAVRRGGGVYCGKTCAFCFFSDPPDAKTQARCIARAARFGCSKLLLLCKSPPQEIIKVNGTSVTPVCGDDVYTLFASLGALPKSTFAPPKRRWTEAFSGALDKDKILRYALLSAALFVMYVFISPSVITLICAIACAALAALSSGVTVAKALKKH